MSLQRMREGNARQFANSENWAKERILEAAKGPLWARVIG